MNWREAVDAAEPDEKGRKIAIGWPEPRGEFPEVKAILSLEGEYRIGPFWSFFQEPEYFPPERLQKMEENYCWVPSTEAEYWFLLGRLVESVYDNL